MRILILFLAAMLAMAAPAAAQDSDGGRVETALGNLAELIGNRKALAAELKALNEAALGDGEEAEERALKIEEIRAELAQLDDQIGAIATGVSDEEFRGQTQTAFDLNAELQALVEPFIAMMRDATENARQIERLRRAQGEARRREALAKRALETLAPVRDQAKDEALIAALTEMETTWAKRADAARDLANALDQQLQDRLSDRGDTRAAANAAASGFFRDRGLSLLLGFAAFTIVFIGLRYAHRTVAWVRNKRGMKRTFRSRLANLVFTVFTLVAATGAMLAVFNMRNDWLLLGVFGVMLLALAWVGIKMLPGAIEQVTLLLNLGAVQEDERVLIDGVPYRVKRLDFYTDFENPALEGADYTLPVRALIGLHSRPSGPDEPWFPTRKGEWVRLQDETFGQIVGQSPEMVEIEVPGGAHMTYATADFLAEKPENLSRGCRAEIVFGLSYRHQADLTGDVMDKLAAHIRTGVARIVPAGTLRDVGVEMLEAADSAVNFEVEADLTGDAAHLFEDVERELVRLCIDACNRYGWEIPFPQMVIHRA